KVYAGGSVYTGSLKDPRTRVLVDARYPGALLDKIEWGAEAVVVGTVVYRLDPQGVIRPLLKVDSVEALENGVRVATKGDLLAQWPPAIARQKRNPPAALPGDRRSLLCSPGARR